jgi:hypothetical protein
MCPRSSGRSPCAHSGRTKLGYRSRHRRAGHRGVRWGRSPRLADQPPARSTPP